jgi:GTP-binding protein EngB required for normal cell division
MTTNSGGLNEFHKRRIRVTCGYIDKLLSDIEAVLWSTASKSAFPKYISDIPPAERRVVEDYISRIRTRLVRTLESQGIEVDPPSIPATRAIHSNLTFVDISVEEMRPRYMRGYGEVPAEAAAELNGIVGELSGLVSQLDRFVFLRAGTDLQQRLEALEAAGTDLALLKTLERIITERGLIEFRSTVGMLIERLEDKSFEIAVFGRVSSGKSSLLNHILQTDVLPVGVTPITAVPTRLMFGETPHIQVWYADNKPSETFDISQLGHFVAEQHNPGNMRHVSRIVAQLPAPTLRDGVTFVDTPGLGSLASSGAAETMAYLPRCDLGVVLIDAGSTLTPEDLNTIQALYQAAIPANVLLSKADLLSELDRTKIVGYVHDHIRAELNLDLSVHPVSVISGYERMLEGWFEQDIAPLFEHRQDLKLRSLQRKIEMLRQSVAAALNSRLLRAEHIPSAVKTDVRTLDSNLRLASARIEETFSTTKRAIEELSRSTDHAISAASIKMISAWKDDLKSPTASTLARSELLGFVLARANAVQDLLTQLADHLTRVLQESARALDLADAPAAGELASVLREMPPFDTASLQLTLSRPALARLLGGTMEQHAAERQIRQQVGPQYTASLKTYTTLLQSWVEDVISQMQRRFDAYANTYRAHVERSLGESEVTTDEKTAIRGDLKQLGGDVTANKVPA